ncbi:MAG: 1-deoxy-D-xylulose-5-phosphate reductoisomerase, partial [Spirochaetaceae bacterium]|nr:1-deoxy-D-xylulose-5-phosphate reductoisomerase [Spirochaetaceae bacterium]
MKKRVAILGATGSIGKSALDVLRAAKDDFSPVLFSAYHDSEGLCALAKEFPQALVALGCKENSGGLSAIDQKQVFYGKEGLLRAIGECGADIAVNGIAGSAGLEPSL